MRIPIFKHSGTSLIEVLISLFLISLLLLGLDAVQLFSLRQSKINYYYAIALQQIQNLHEELTVTNRPDLDFWNLQNQQVLPQGRGELSAYAISIFWGNRDEKTCDKTKIRENGCLQLRLP